MMNQQNEVTILSRAQEDREDFIRSINEVVKLKEIILGSQETIKAIMNTQYDKHKDANAEPLKKGKFNKKYKIVIEEHLEAKATTTTNDLVDAIEVYEIIKNKLI